MGCLGSGNDAFGAREEKARFETGILGIGLRFNQSQFLEVAHQRSHAMVAQAAGMKSGRHEG